VHCQGLFDCYTKGKKEEEEADVMANNNKFKFAKTRTEPSDIMSIYPPA
jgi:hypothetical protein